MTKRIFSVFLAFVLCALIVVPSFAASTGTYIKLEDKSSSNSYFDTYGKVKDASTNSEVKFGYTVPDGGATVLLFYNANDAYGSERLFTELGEAGWANSGKVNFIAIEASKASASDAASFISKHNKNGFVDKAYYDTNDVHLLSWYYTYIKNDGSVDGSINHQLTYCYAVFITSENGKNYIRYSLSATYYLSQIADVLNNIMDTSVFATGYSGYLNSGNSAQSKLSKPQIAKLLDDNPQYAPDTDAGYFETAPVVSGSYATGKVKDFYLQAATKRLSALRNIAGLPSVTMDAQMNTQAQYGAVLLAASNFSHYPAKPDDMDEDFWQKGQSATSSSNLAGGRHLTSTPDGFMKDEGINNLSVMGHRRWQLNPTMAKVGFGYAVNQGNMYTRYAVEKAHDQSGPSIDYRFISWPASGNFPKELFDYDTAWSVTLSPVYYQTPDINSVNVTVTKESDGRKWTFSNSETYTETLYDKYFTVETNGYGVSNCIIFRPDGINANDIDGIYTVVISGLRDTFGHSVSLSYKVDFFNYGDYVEMKHGWYLDAGTGRKYYYNQDGTMVKSKLMTIEGKKYYFGSDGAMYTKRLISVSGKKYYMGADGAAYTKRLISVNGKKYYMGADGVAYKSKLISVDGKKYYIGSDCVAYKSKLASIDGKKYYFGSDCIMYKSKLASISGKKYYFGKDGVAYKSKLISVSGKKYYIGKDCIAYKSKFASLSGKKYYFGSDCVMYKSKTFSVSGVKWKADSNGVCKKV